MAALINVPARARRGDIIEIRTLTSHIMETGFRHTMAGALVPRDILTSFTCRYNGDIVFSAELHPAVSANPYIAFYTVATASGTLEFSWQGDHGFAQTETMPITVSAA